MLFKETALTKTVYKQQGMVAALLHLTLLHYECLLLSNACNPVTLSMFIIKQYLKLCYLMNVYY